AWWTGLSKRRAAVGATEQGVLRAPRAQVRGHRARAWTPCSSFASPRAAWPRRGCPGRQTQHGACGHGVRPAGADTYARCRVHSRGQVRHCAAAMPPPSDRSLSPMAFITHVSVIGFATALSTRAVDPIIPPIAHSLQVDAGRAALLSTAFTLPFVL